MINYYPTWKYIIVFFVLMMGLLYSLPNLYKEDLVVFISKNVSFDKKPNAILLNDIEKILQSEKIKNKSIFLNQDSIQIYFDSESDQLCIYKKLSNFFLGKYLVSYKKISSMPNWLHFIRAKPIQLGLDLKGGLYLILRVDILTILHKFQAQYIDILQSILNEKKIACTTIRKIKDYDIEIIFKNFDDKNQFISFLSEMYSNILSCDIIDAYKVNITFTRKYINSIYDDAIQKNSIILRHRMHRLKILDPIIQRYGNNCIAVELPGIEDITTIKSLLSNNTYLEFRLVNNNINMFQIDNNLIPEDSEIKLDAHNNIVPLYKNIILTGDHIISTDVNFDEYYRPQLNIYLDNFGSVVLSKFTKDNVGKLIATVLIEYKDSKTQDIHGYPILCKQEKIINVAMIQSQLTRNFCISGFNDIKEVNYLASLLKVGSLYSPMCIEEERIISAVVGQKNIIQGIIACGLSVLFSICFMIIWYRCFGLIAGIALIVNLILIISIMSIIPGIVLTMSSIVGIVLTLSVSIDANVLINERIKEEIKQNKPIQYAIYMGYKKAFNSIVDANVTTIITAIVLYIMGTDSIKGFAMVTIIGVGTSMFTSIIGTRTLVNILYGKKSIDHLSI